MVLSSKILYPVRFVISTSASEEKSAPGKGKISRRYAARNDILWVRFQKYIQASSANG
jgi:hypothetical protein